MTILHKQSSIRLQALTLSVPEKANFSKKVVSIFATAGSETSEEALHSFPRDTNRSASCRKLTSDFCVFVAQDYSVSKQYSGCCIDVSLIVDFCLSILWFYKEK